MRLPGAKPAPLGLGTWGLGHGWLALGCVQTFLFLFFRVISALTHIFHEMNV